MPPVDRSVKTVVLLPGMDGTGELFSRFVTALGPGIEALVLRYPTHRPLSYADLAARVCEALPTDRPYVLLAESFSGPIGIELAAQGPAQLKGLVLCCTFARNPRPAMRALRALLPVIPWAAMPVAPLGRVLMGGDFDRVLQDELAKVIGQLPAPVMRARLQAVLDVDATARWGEVRQPTLYLRAERDLVVSRSAGEWLLKTRPATELVELPGPHFLLQTRPGEAAAAVKRFLQRLG
jgi:pimeloyl-ACP methyl ester carboxylesterase